ncbi:MAG: hypothetical protein HY617_00180 [Candidatus Sungbacteria bacterium]|nr:hypothetical protein [Candidatus Sungbacteria bacterium]
MDAMHTPAELERYKRATEGLGIAISELTWLRDFFWVIVLDERRAYYFDILGKRADGLSARSSTFYACSSSARAAATNEENPAKKVLWLCIAGVCLARAYALSQRLVRQIGTLRLTNGQLNIRAYILAAVRKYQEAHYCIDLILENPDASADNQALMYRLRADICRSQKDYADAEMAIQEALSFRTQLSASTLVRIFRSYALLRRAQDRLREAENIEADANALAGQHGLPGQQEKIRVIPV